MKLRLVRMVLWGAVAGLTLMLVAAKLGWIGPLAGRPTSVSSMRNDALPIGSEFELVDHTGNQRRWSDFRGKPAAVFFGFTNCPDICPMTLGELSVVLSELDENGDRGNDLQVVLVSGDPKRDTPEVLGSYLESFDPRIVGLTGSEEQIAEAFKMFRAYRRVVPLDGGNYTVDHSAGIYLYDAQGVFFGTLDKDEPAKTRMVKIDRLLESRSGGSAGEGM